MEDPQKNMSLIFSTSSQKIRTRDGWVGSAKATSVLCRHPRFSLSSSLSISYFWLLRLTSVRLAGSGHLRCQNVLEISIHGHSVRAIAGLTRQSRNAFIRNCNRSKYSLSMASCISIIKNLPRPHDHQMCFGGKRK